MKRVLILEKSPSAILTNGFSSPDEVAVAMITDNKFMQDLAKVFKEKLGISNENKNWKKELMQASKKQIKILKTENKRKNRKVIKEQKAMARKRTEWLKKHNCTQDIVNINEPNNEMAIKENDEGANISTLGYWKIEKIYDEPPVMNKKRVVDEYTVVSKEQQNINYKTSPEINVNAIMPSCNHQPRPKSEDIKINSTMTNADKSTEILNSPADVNLSGSNALDKTNEENVTHVIDPFFITDGGENYRSSAVVVRNGLILDPQNFKKTVEYESLENKTKRSRETNRENQKSYDSFRETNAQERISHKSIRKAVDKYKTEGLHPSWVAKQKFKTVISSFQCKKIRFKDDNHIDEGSIKNNSKKVNIEIRNKKLLSTNRRKNEHTKEAAHSSWAAKQRFSAAITDFKGEKITFGDDGVLLYSSDRINVPSQSENLNNLNGLHPSWLAKQKQKPTIIKFQGKKTTFQDDE